MFARLADFVVRHWMLVIVLWVCAVILVRVPAPPWDEITHDGDFAYLPATLPSVVGEKLMTEAFPRQRGRSQIVVAIGRRQRALSNDDIQVAYDVARRMKNLYGAARVAQARQLAEQRWPEQESPGAASEDAQYRELVKEQFEVAVAQASEALQDALLLDQKLADHWQALIGQQQSLAKFRPPRLAAIYHNLALLAALQGDTEAAEANRRLAVQLDAALTEAPDKVLPAGAESLPLVDVWTWRDGYFGDKLISRDNCVRLVVLQLTNEFMAVDNIHVLRVVEGQLEPVRQYLDDRAAPGLEIVQSGSAAVGADLLRSAAASIHNTEVFTVLLVVMILALVYRAPLLIAVPILTILVSLLVSTGLVALLTQLSEVPGFGWWSLKVFSTTKIFVVVILFGAGTDYCLFLIARYKEELRNGMAHDAAVSAALSHVGDALAASALTTVLGLSMMFFADFGKFRYSGPVIGLCLAVTLVNCVTLTPALMRGLGPLLFWPFGVSRNGGPEPESAVLRGSHRLTSWIWNSLASAIVTRPGLILTVSIALLLPLAVHGVMRGHDVTYDFLSGLPARCPSRQGADMLRQHFPVGESGPVTVLVERDNARFDTPEGRDRIRQLSDQLHIPGVVTVRSVEDPLGDYAPGEKPGILSDRGRTLRILRAHPRTKAIFVAQTPELAGNVARLELILDRDPFSLAAIEIVDRVQQTLHALAANPKSFWNNARFALTGTTAAIRDLRTVTQRDNIRIEILVVLAVLLVLLVILRRPAVCIYMMVSVLFSFYVTMGVTTLFFAYCYGDSYQGLDWKVPLFLFVILVAVGQDYNVYLATRVFEEQGRLGPLAGLRRAVVQTGGIITSCGVIMAGTFISMTSTAWGAALPASLAAWTGGSFGPLRSIVEMGTALAIGVLLDTFVVRPVLVPAFLALVTRWQPGPNTLPRK